MSGGGQGRDGEAGGAAGSRVPAAGREGSAVPVPIPLPPAPVLTTCGGGRSPPGAGAATCPLRALSSGGEGAAGKGMREEGGLPPPASLSLTSSSSSPPSPARPGPPRAPRPPPGLASPGRGPVRCSGTYCVTPVSLSACPLGKDKSDRPASLAAAARNNFVSPSSRWESSSFSFFFQ